MLRGHVFSEQIFSNEAFAVFIDTFLNKKCGVIKGCNLTNTTNSITISDGYFCIRGRFLQVLGSNVVDVDLNANLYVDTDSIFCKLICEIDLSKNNTETSFEQANFKIISNVNDYPELVKQDITEDGTIYQFEFAKFKTNINGIIDFTDTRSFLDFNSIYNQVNEQTQALIEQIKQEIENVKNGSIYTLNTDFVLLEGYTTMSTGESPFARAIIQYPKGYNKDNCVVISVGKKRDILDKWAYGQLNNSTGLLTLALPHVVELKDDNIEFNVYGLSGMNETYIIQYKILLATKIYNEPELQKGDVNGDGVINLDDAEAIKSYIMGNVSLTKNQYIAADMNNDGEISASDYVSLKNIIEGKQI